VLSVDETLELLATRAEEEGCVPFVSGTLYIEAEYYRGAVIWTADHKRVTRDQAAAMITAAREHRSKLNIIS
jgi:aminoglycoside phosphotransferase (APT) family kinase protein